MDIKVISWNIWQGKYKDNVIALLQKLDADIIGLQEVTEKEEQGKRENIASEIAQKLGYYCVYYKAFTTDRHTPSFDLGNAILSRFPLLHPKCIFLSDLTTYTRSAVNEPRIAIKAQVAGEKPITCINTHLGYSDRCLPTPTREQQFEHLLPILPSSRGIVFGDFNSLPDSTIVRILNTRLLNTDLLLEKPSWTDVKDTEKKQYRIDYIYVTRDLKVKDFNVLTTDASDHMLLKTIIEV